MSMLEERLAVLLLAAETQEGIELKLHALDKALETVPKAAVEGLLTELAGTEPRPGSKYLQAALWKLREV